MVKLTSFDSYCSYNVFCLTFRRNHWVLIEKKVLGLSLRKNRSDEASSTKRNRAERSEEHRTMLQACTTVLQFRKGGIACPCRVARPSHQFLGFTAARASLPSAQLNYFSDFKGFASFLGEAFFLDSFEGQLGFNLAFVNPFRERLD